MAVHRNPLSQARSAAAPLPAAIRIAGAPPCRDPPRKNSTRSAVATVAFFSGHESSMDVSGLPSRAVSSGTRLVTTRREVEPANLHHPTLRRPSRGRCIRAVRARQDLRSGDIPGHSIVVMQARSRWQREPRHSRFSGGERGRPPARRRSCFRASGRGRSPRTWPRGAKTGPTSHVPSAGSGGERAR